MMQSILECLMRQAEKVELFKKYQRPLDALHSKFAVGTKGTVCGDADWGHLQMDAISLYLLTLAQITASGLQVVRNFDEVAFIQNLVYYIETGYRTPVCFPKTFKNKIIKISNYSGLWCMGAWRQNKSRNSRIECIIDRNG